MKVLTNSNKIKENILWFIFQRLCPILSALDLSRNRLACTDVYLGVSIWVRTVTFFPCFMNVLVSRVTSQSHLSQALSVQRNSIKFSFVLWWDIHQNFYHSFNFRTTAHARTNIQNCSTIVQCIAHCYLFFDLFLKIFICITKKIKLYIYHLMHFLNEICKFTVLLFSSLVSSM